MVRTIVGIILIWALLFGVNIKGRHYGISCTGNGVSFELGER